MSESEERQAASVARLRRRLVDSEVVEAERRVLQDAPRHSEERFAMLATTIFDAILIQNKGLVLDCNLSLAEMFGYARSEVAYGAFLVITMN
jgi:PAS domain-containing protein